MLSSSVIGHAIPEPRVNVLLAALTSLLIAVFATAFAAPHFIDWNDYRSVFEAQASKLAGRPVRVSGEVDLTILPVPEVRFEEVSIADASGSFEAPSATARAFRMALSVPPLLRGKVEARKIELDQLSLRLGLDESGQVDWPRIGEAAGALPFLPADVSLKSVTLNEASLAVARPGEPARWRIEGVTGELTAETLRGPFKFAGRAAIGDQFRDIQISVGRMSADDLMPVKVVSRGEAVIYRAEGNLREFAEGPVFAGDVEASAPLAPDASPQTPPKWQATARGRVTLDGAGFDDLKLTITRKQRPQTLTGTAKLTWGRALRLDAQLESRWLDLDLLAGAQVRQSMPAEVLLRLPVLLGDVPVPAQRAQIALRVAQISLGGDLIRDFHAVARRGEAGWGVEKLEAGLPGSSELAFEGSFAREGGAAILAGAVAVSGGNLGRLLQWAAPGMFEASDAAAKSFSLSGEVESGPQTFAIADIAARLGDSRLGGAMRFGFGERPTATIELDARTLDLRPYTSGGTAKLVGKLTADRPNARSLADWTHGDWRIALRANRLLLPELTANDFDTALRIDGDAITVEKLSLRGPDGLRLSGSGRYPRDGAQEAPALRIALAANSAGRLLEAVRAIPGGREWLDPHASRLRAATPLSLTASLGPSKVEDGLWLRVDGTAGQTGLLASARFYGAGRYHVSMSAENPAARALTRQLAPRLTEWIGGETAAAPARFSADFTGARGEPWRGEARLETDGVRLAFDGTAQGQRLNGALKIDAPDAAQALALAGLTAEAGPSGGGAMVLSASLSSEDDVYSARDLRISLDGQSATGSARLDVSGPVPEAEVNLNASRFNLANAAALLLERRDEAPDQAWPDTPFASDSISRFSGSLSLAADELVIAEHLSMQEATLMARLEGGELRVPALSGMFYGGEAVASVELRPARGRTVFNGDLAVSRLDLTQLPRGDGPPLASGRANITLRVESEGLSPRGLITVMSGRGQLELSKGEIRGLDPEQVARAARGYLAAEEQPEDSIAARLAQPLRESRLEHDGLEAELRLTDGALRIAEMPVYRGADGQQVRARARIDLSEMTLQSQWDLGAALGGDALPEVRVSFAGPLSAFGTLEPRIDADDLQQFLTVSRVERNVELLEQLRRERDAAERGRGQSVPTQSLGSAAPETEREPAQEGADPRGLLLETPDPLPGFSTEIENTPATTPQPAAGSAGTARPSSEASQPSSPATSAPGAGLDDPQVVEDARREIMREPPQRRRRNPDPFYEIFRN